MFDRHKSMEPFEGRCRWWLPASPTFQVQGTLAFSGTKFVAIMDEWVGADSPSDFPSAEVVHGKLADGTAFTVFDAFVQAYDVAVTIGLNSIAVGAHLEPLTQQQFSTATARMNGLDKWWAPKFFDIEDSANGETNIKIAPPTGTSWRIEDQLATIGLAQTKVMTGCASFSSRIEICYENMLRFTPDIPKPYIWFDRIINDARQLLTLFLDQHAALLGMELEALDRAGNCETVQWYWAQHDDRVDEIKPFLMLLPFRLLENQLESCIQAWLSRTEALRMARALIFSTEANPAPFLETRFLPVIQALEVFCNASGSEKYVPASEFDRIKQSLIATIPDNLPHKLNEKLRTSIGFANELSLNDRILHLLNALEPATRRFVCQDATRFARWLKDTRNYYTHYGDSRGKHLTGKALHWATEQASLLLKLVMLKECGVPESLLQQRLSMSHYRSQGMQIWAGIEKELLSPKGAQ